MLKSTIRKTIVLGIFILYLGSTFSPQASSKPQIPVPYHMNEKYMQFQLTMDHQLP